MTRATGWYPKGGEFTTDNFDSFWPHIGATAMSKETVAESPYLTASESADYCRVNRSTLWRAVKAGKLKQYGPGTAVRYRRDELDRFMDARNHEK